MDNPHLVDTPEPELILERDIFALLAMLDYLISEIAKIDAMSTQCLILARKSLAEAVAEAFVRTH
jgi:hypothetical protein